MAYDNKNRGSIWKNKKKEKDTHPDFTGTLDVDGVEYWVSAWKRKEDAKPEAPALTFSVKPKEAKAERHGERQSESAPRVARRASAEIDDDSVPF